MNGQVLHFPAAAAPARDDHQGLNLTPDEVVEVSGGYVQPAAQLKALHARGFVRAWRRPGGPVILERAHHDAVVRGQFGQQQDAAAAAEPPTPPRPNRAALQQRFRKGGG